MRVLDYLPEDEYRSWQEEEKAREKAQKELERQRHQGETAWQRAMPEEVKYPEPPAPEEPQPTAWQRAFSSFPEGTPQDVLKGLRMGQEQLRQRVPGYAGAADILGRGVQAETDIGRWGLGKVGEGFDWERRNVQYPLLESRMPTAGGFSGATGIAPPPTADIPPTPEKSWEERWEPFPGYKGGIEMAIDPLNLIPLEKGPQLVRKGVEVAGPLLKAARESAPAIREAAREMGPVARGLLAGERGGGTIEGFTGTTAKGIETAMWEARARGATPQEIEAIRAQYMGTEASFPGRTKRFYHGTGSAFEAPEPSKFDPNGLYGPGYYLTDNPEVAASYANLPKDTSYLNEEHVKSLEGLAYSLRKRLEAPTPLNPELRRSSERQLEGIQWKLDQIGANAKQGPNIRPVDVPENLNLFRADQSNIESTVIDRVAAGLPKGLDNSFKTQINNTRWQTPQQTVNGDAVYNTLADVANGKANANAALQQAGFDGIAYQGGQRIPLMDTNDNAILHNTAVVFPESLSKIRNALSGTQGGQAQIGPALDIGGGAVGAASQYDPNATPEENAARMAMGGVVGAGLVHAGRKGLAGLSVEDVSKGKQSKDVQDWLIQDAEARWKYSLQNKSWETGKLTPLIFGKRKLAEDAVRQLPPEDAAKVSIIATGKGAERRFWVVNAERAAKDMSPVQSVAEAVPSPAARVEPPASPVAPLPTAATGEVAAKQPEIVLYHGTDADYPNPEITTGKRMFGIHLTTAEEAAREYGKVKTYVLASDARVLDLSDGDSLWEYMRKNEILDEEDLNNIDLQNYVTSGQIYQYDVSSRTHFADFVAKQAKNDGYDVVKMIDNLRGLGDDTAYVVVNPKMLKSPDLAAKYPQASEVPPVAPEPSVQARIEPPAPVLPGTPANAAPTRPGKMAQPPLQPTPPGAATPPQAVQPPLLGGRIPPPTTPPIGGTPPTAAAVPPTMPPVPPTPPTGGTAVTPPTASSWLPTVKSTDEVLKAAYQPDVVRRVVDKFDNPVTRNVAQAIGVPERDVFTQGLVLRETIIADWKSAVTGASARVRELGSSEKLFKVDKDGMGYVGGKKAPINDVMEYPDRYTLTPEQKEYAQRIHKLYDDQKAALNAEGIDVNELHFEQGGHYVGRRVVGKLDDQGNIELAEIRGAGGKRVGAKMGFEKSRSFETQAEAIAEGFRYLSPEEALQANLDAAGRKIADNRLADFILSQIPYRTGQAPDALKIAKEYAQERLAAVGKLKATILRGYRGERVPEATVRSIGKHFPDQAKILVDAGISKMENYIQRSLLQQAEAAVPQLQAGARATYYKARSALAEAAEKARQPKYGEGMVQAPAFQGKFFSEADAKRLRQILDLEQKAPIRGAAETISWVNALPRMLMTTFDIGGPLIQGQMTLFTNLPVWAKSVGQAMKALASEKGYQQFLATHADTIRKWSQEGATFTPSEFTTAIQTGGIVTKMPVLREVVKPFARNYEAFLNALRIYGLEATEHLAKTAEDRVGLAKFWNEMSGQVDTAKMGISRTQREIETAVLFAPRYRRATLTLMSDIAKGGLRGKMAREAVAKTTLFGLAGYMGVSYSMGQEPKLDPRDPKFLTVNMAGQNIGIGGAYFGTVRTLLRMTLEPEKAHEHAATYVRNLTSPLVSTTIRALQYPYMYNGPLKLAKEVVASNMIPIWMQSMVLEGQSAEGAIVGAVVEGAGGKAFSEKDKGESLTPFQKRLQGSGSSKLTPFQKRLQGNTNNGLTPFQKRLQAVGQ